MEVWYRYEDMRWAPPLNEFDEPVGSGRSDIRLLEFEVLKHTPKGVWVGSWSNKRFVLTSARKRYACPTKQEALDSFIARKKRQQTILRNQLQHVKTVLAMAENKEGRYKWT